MSRYDSDEVRSIAAGAERALAVRWVPGGRVPAHHAVEAILAIVRDEAALLVALGSALAKLQSTELPDREHARVCLSVWAPVAAKLGAAALEHELEDRAFRILDPKAYDEVERFVQRTRAGRVQAVDEAKRSLEGELAAFGLRATVSGRAKHLYSVHKKLTSRNDREPSLFDLFGLRVVVPSVADCYQALGVVHLAFSPVPRRFKDYVARPKPNGYRSLHTVVRLSRSADPVEVQIRSEEMHAEAERGRAAHVRYKHPELSSETDRWVYALTPAGEVRRLPRGATVLDFAYAIHTEIGRGYAGARIGEGMVAATRELATGDVVEVFHIARPGGAATQLASVHTARARNRIRAGLIARAAY